jgi:hypothetical protein
MDSRNKVVEMIVEQGQNVLVSMKDLKRSAHKKGRERSKLYVRFVANEHSFNVYLYIDAEIEQLAEVQYFQHKLELFRELFTGVQTDFDKEVEVKTVESIYEETNFAYKSLKNVLEG